MLPLAVRFYVAATAVVAAAAALLLAVVDQGDVVDRPWLVAVFGALIALEHLFETRLVLDREQGESYGHEESYFVAMALLASPIAVVLAFAGGFAAGNLLRRRVPIKLVFNVAAMVASVSAALLAIEALGGGRPSSVRAVLAVLAGAAVFVVVNRSLLSGVLAAAGAGTFRSNFLDDLRGRLLITSGDVSIGLLAGVAGAAHTWALPFGIAAMIALHFALAGHVRARAERQKLVDIVDATSDGIVVVDRRDRVRSWNPASEAITGHSAASMIGRTLEDVFELLEPDDLREAGGGEPELARIRSREGELRWLAITRAPLPEGGCVLVIRDETTRREVEEMRARHEREQMQAQLVAAVSHELRTPLTSILGFTRTLLAHDHDPRARARYLHIVAEEAERLRTLIDDLLDLRRAAEGQLRLELVPIDLNAMLGEQVELFTAESHAHELVLDVPAEPLWVHADRDRLRQVVANLLSNAIKYSPEGGEVKVSAARANGAARIAVTDIGVGISAEEQSQIFTRFFRSAQAQRQGIGGSGLGLALAREIVEAHGGRIGFESNEDVGSTFYVELPLDRG
jgi:PAS domain S-box-containing protein